MLILEQLILLGGTLSKINERQKQKTKFALFSFPCDGAYCRAETKRQIRNIAIFAFHYP
jgi:hypothetical protein